MLIYIVCLPHDYSRKMAAASDVFPCSQPMPFNSMVQPLNIQSRAAALWCFCVRHHRLSVQYCSTSVYKIYANSRTQNKGIFGQPEVSLKLLIAYQVFLFFFFLFFFFNIYTFQHYLPSESSRLKYLCMSEDILSWDTPSSFMSSVCFACSHTFYANLYGNLFGAPGNVWQHLKALFLLV